MFTLDNIIHILLTLFTLAVGTSAPIIYQEYLKKRQRKLKIYYRLYDPLFKYLFSISSEHRNFFWIVGYPITCEIAKSLTINNYERNEFDDILTAHLRVNLEFVPNSIIELFTSYIYNVKGCWRFYAPECNVEDEHYALNASILFDNIMYNLLLSGIKIAKETGHNQDWDILLNSFQITNNFDTKNIYQKNSKLPTTHQERYLYQPQQLHKQLQKQRIIHLQFQSEETKHLNSNDKNIYNSYSIPLGLGEIVTSLSAPPISFYYNDEYYS